MSHLFPCLYSVVGVQLDDSITVKTLKQITKSCIRYSVLKSDNKMS